MNQQQIETLAKIILPIPEARTWITWNIAEEIAKDILSEGYNKHEINLAELAELIWDAFGEFVNAECPRCNCYTGADRYVDDADIKKWLERVIGDYDL